MMRSLIIALVLTGSQTVSASELATTPAPIEMRWMNNQDPAAIYRSTNHPNAVFVVEAYFNSCPACNQNASKVDSLREHFDTREDVQILDVSRDCRMSDYQSWVSRHRPNHPVLNDCNMTLLGRLGTRVYPTTYILDCNLNLITSFVGVWSTDVYNRIINTVDNAVAAGCVPTGG